MCQGRKYYKIGQFAKRITSRDFIVQEFPYSEGNYDHSSLKYPAYSPLYLILSHGLCIENPFLLSFIMFRILKKVMLTFSLVRPKIGDDEKSVITHAKHLAA